MAQERPTFSSDFKRFFLRGLAVLLPSVLTLWLLVQAYLFVEAKVADPINRALRQGVLWAIPRMVPEQNLPAWFKVTDEEVRQFRAALEAQATPAARALAARPDNELRAVVRAEELRRFWDAHWYFRFIGLVVAIVLIYLAGLLLGGLIGRSIYEQVERFLTRIPVFKQVYPHVKQLVDLVLGERSMAFKRVVFIEYPRKGVWTLAFVTGSGLRGAADVARGDVLTVFVPSTPTPFTGFTITVRREEALDAPITIDEAIRFVLTGGVLSVGPQLEGRGAGPASGGAAPLPAAESASDSGGAAPEGGRSG